MEAMDTGSIPIGAGLGFLIIHGAGVRFIMEGGFMMIFTDGFGFPDMNGRRLG